MALRRLAAIATALGTLVAWHSPIAACDGDGRRVHRRVRGFALAWDEVVPGSEDMHAANTRSEVVFTAVR